MRPPQPDFVPLQVTSRSPNGWLRGLIAVVLGTLGGVAGGVFGCQWLNAAQSGKAEADKVAKVEPVKLSSEWAVLETAIGETETKLAAIQLDDKTREALTLQLGALKAGVAKLKQAAVAEAGLSRVETTLTQLNKDTKQGLDALSKQLADLTKKPQRFDIEPHDVVLTAFHSERLPIGRYKEAVRELLLHRFVPDGTPQYRLAFAVASGDNLDIIAALGAEPKLDRLSTYLNPTPGAAENPTAVGMKVKEVFGTRVQAGLRRRCILLASTRAVAPDPFAPPWNDYDVEVVLLTVDPLPNDAEATTVRKWADFASARGGTVALFRQPDIARPTEAAQATLARKLVRAALPMLAPAAAVTEPPKN